MPLDPGVRSSPPEVRGRIPSLDGLRALSVFLVVCLHTMQRLKLRPDNSFFLSSLIHGSTGVYVFFEISGFLITTLLLEEYRKYGSIRMGAFYVRRAFRILPPLYVYIGVTILLGLAGRLVVDWKTMFSAMFFYKNLYIHSNDAYWSVEHLWSIAVEEQFYLVWPFVLYLCMRATGKPLRRTAAILPVAVLVASPILRIGFTYWHTNLGQFIARTVLRFDFIMFGCLIALWQHSPRFEAVYRAVTRRWWVLPLAILLCNVLSTRYQNYFDLPVGHTISGFLIAMSLLWCVRNPDSAIGRVLSFRPIAWIGTLSYSIYLWQTLWIHPNNTTVFAPMQWMGSLPQSWLGFMLCAAASYYLVEQPSLRLRDRVMRWMPARPPKQRVESETLSS